MFVTREERQPLGGLLSFILPMLGFGLLATVSLWLPLPGYLNGLLATLGLTLLYLWRTDRLGATLIVSVAVAATIAGEAALVDAAAGGLGAFALLLSWICLAVLAGAMLDDIDGGLVVPPAWRHVFPRLVSLPIMVVVLWLLMLLAGFILLAVLQVANLVNADAGAGFDSVLGGLSASSSPVLLALAGLSLGASAAAIRFQRSLVGAVRYALLAVSRYLLPVAAVITLTAWVASRDEYVYSVEDRAALCLAGAASILVTILLVYADGRARRPSAWLQLWVITGAAVAGLALIPQLSLVLAAGGIVVSGSTVVTAVALLFLAAILAGLASDFIPGQRRWMPLLAPVNTALMLLIGILPVLLYAFGKMVS